MKNCLKFLGIIAMVAVMVFSCASINTSHMASNIPANDHAFLYIQDVNLVTGFGINQEPRGVKSFDVYGNGVLLPPGNHTIYITGRNNLSNVRGYFPLPVSEEYIKHKVPVTWSTGTDSDGNRIQSTPMVSFQFVFEPGHFYVLYNPYRPDKADEREYRNYFIIVDETNPQLTWANNDSHNRDITRKDAERRISKAKKKMGG